MTSAVFRRKRTRVQETDSARAEEGKRPMLFLALTCEIVDAVFNVMCPNADIKTEDGLSHSPGQTGLLGYSNFSGTPPSQSLYGYSHTHGQSHTLYHTHTHTPCTRRFDFNLAGRSIHLLLPSFLFSSSRFPSRCHTCSPLVVVWTSGVKHPPPPLLSSWGQTRFLHSDQQRKTQALKSVGENESIEEAWRATEDGRTGNGN